MKILDRFLVEVSDYHQLDLLRDFIKNLTDKHYKCHELSDWHTEKLETSCYTGLMYRGKRPKWESIKKLKVINFDA